MKRSPPLCTFTAIGMVCVLPAGHPSEPVFGGHHLARRDIVEWREGMCEWDVCREPATHRVQVKRWAVDVTKRTVYERETCEKHLRASEQKAAQADEAIRR